MSKIKVLIVLIFLSIGIQKTHGQVYKFLSTGFSVMEKNEKGKWGKWSNLEKTTLIITLDTNKNRIVVYSQEIQLYKIVAYQAKQETDNDLTYTFNCKDENGDDFTLAIITRKNQQHRKQLYINQKNVIVVYNIVNYEDK